MNIDWLVNISTLRLKCIAVSPINTLTPFEQHSLALNASIDEKYVDTC